MLTRKVHLPKGYVVTKLGGTSSQNDGCLTVNNSRMKNAAVLRIKGVNFYILNFNRY